MSACFPDRRCHATSARKISPFRCSTNLVRSCDMACQTARQREHQRTRIDLDQFGVTAMEESGEYRVTRSKGRGPGRKIRKVIFRHLDEALARRFYERMLRDNQNHVRCVNQASLTLVSFIHRKLHPAIMMSGRQTAVKPSPSGSRRWRLRA